MSVSDNHCIELAKLPNIKLLMCKSLLKKSNQDSSKKARPVLHNHSLCVKGLCPPQDKLALFHQVVNWQGDELHPCYIHTLAFPLHLQLLLDPEFPFPLLGLVHIENTIDQFRAIHNTERLSISCRLADLVAHPKGWLFSIISECSSDNEIVWRSTSVNLYRTNHQIQVAIKIKEPIAEYADSALSESWFLAANLGRLYAKASGDYNPIHLAKWSAKLFGFKQQIIHGMWTKSRCLSELQKQQTTVFKNEFSVQVRFKLPLFLPSTVAMVSQFTTHKEQGKTITFKVETHLNNLESRPHLLGAISFN